jgi:hypothetical protein
MPQGEAPNLVIARLLDYWGRRTDWQRRLWNPSTSTVLHEALESARELEAGQLREAAVRDLAGSAERRAGPDLGVGPSEVRALIVDTLRRLPKSMTARRQLEHLLKAIATNYLRTWRDEFTSSPGVVPTEQISRVIGAHLLDVGHSPEALHRWATWLRSHTPPATVAELLDVAADVADRPRRTWTVFVPFRSLPRHRQKMPEQWREPTDAHSWLAEHAPEVTVRHNGGFVIAVEAVDPWAAVEQVSDLIESLSARVAVGLPGQSSVEPEDHAVVAGSRHLFSLGRPRRQVDIHSLHRQNVLYDVSAPALAGRLRSAIDLVAPLETGAPGAAIAGGWAAIEAVLARPDVANVDAAADLASLVACSFPRAELTPLAYAYVAENDGQLAADLRAAQSNRSKCRLLADAIADGSDLAFAQNSDRAALMRMRGLLSDPRAVLGRVSGYVEEAVRRLYRQRNLVLHAGRTDSVAMTATLRTIPPLVGAGLDRLVHAALTSQDFDEVQLVARARTELRLVGGPGGSHVVDLLDTAQP